MTFIIQGQTIINKRRGVIIEKQKSQNRCGREGVRNSTNVIEEDSRVAHNSGEFICEASKIMRARANVSNTKLVVIE